MTLLLLILACAPVVIDDPDEAIEITGYLDDARTSVTSDQQFEQAPVSARIIGLSGASGQIGELTVKNETSGAEVVGMVQADGSFIVEAAAANGDVLSVSQYGAASISLSASTLAAFPDHTQTHIERPDDHTMTVALDLLAGPGHTFVLTNPLQGLVIEMQEPTSTSVAGTIAAEIGERVFMHGIDPAGAPTLAVALTEE